MRRSASVFQFLSHVVLTLKLMKLPVVDNVDQMQLEQKCQDRDVDILLLRRQMFVSLLRGLFCLFYLLGLVDLIVDRGKHGPHSEATRGGRSSLGSALPETPP